MTYEDFKEEFTKVYKEHKNDTYEPDLVLKLAWMAFGRLNAKIERDEWGRIKGQF